MDLYLNSLGGPGGALAAVAGFLATAYLLGKSCLGRSTDFAPWEKVFLSLTLGIDLLVLASFALSFTSLLHPIYLEVPLFGALLYMIWHLPRWIPTVFRKRPWHLLPILVIGLVLFGNGLCYPFAWDDLTYQIAVPQRWLKAGSPQVFPDNPFSGFPGANLFANLLLLATGGVLAPGLFHAGLWLIFSLELFFLIREILGPGSAVILSLSLGLSLPGLMVTMSAYAEPFVLLQATAIFLFFNHWLRKRPLTPFVARDWLLPGIFAGMAASVKLTGLIIPIGVGLFLLRLVYCQGSWKSFSTLRAVFLFALAALLVMLIFYLRPFLMTANPTYPFFASHFSKHEPALATSTYHHDLGVKYGYPPVDPCWGGVYYLLTPLLLALGPITELGNYDGYAGLQWFPYYGLLVFLLWARFKGKKADIRTYFFLGFAGLLYTFWFFSSQQARYLLPILFALTLGGSFGLQIMAPRPRMIFLILILVLTLVSIPGRIGKHFLPAWRALVGNISATDYLYTATGDGYLKACDAILRGTPSEAKVLLLYEHRGLYIPRRYEVGTPYFQEKYFTPPTDFISGEKIFDVLRQGEISHVLVGFTSKDPDRMQKYMEKSRPFQDRIRSLIRQGTLWPLWQEEGFGLYEVKYSPLERNQEGNIRERN